MNGINRILPAAINESLGCAFEALGWGTRQTPEFIILDMGRWDVDDLEIVRRLRTRTQAPILLLSGRAGGAGEASGSTPDASTTRVQIGDLVVDLVAKRVIRSKRKMDAADPVADVRLTPTEWRLLEVLLRSPGRLLSTQHLLAEA